ncbi:MAG: SDR family NAD(P)-dependent oxidoreductase [Rhodospirillales bacterium]
MDDSNAADRVNSAHRSIVWISGATEGIGLGLARHVPYAGARIINLSRRQHPEFESIRLDLADPSSWDHVARHFRGTLGDFAGDRVIFIQNAHLRGLTGFAGEVAAHDYRTDITANLTAPIVIAESFLRAVIESGFAGEVGIVLLSSAAARSPYEGQSIYCAGKAAAEMWVRVVRRELARRGRTQIWVTAVRPGFVDTATTRFVASLPPHDYPAADAIAAQFSSGAGVFDIDTAARQIWQALPTKKSLLLFGEQVQMESIS